MKARHLIIITVLFFLSSFVPVSAQLPGFGGLGVGTVFGGRVITSVPCTNGGVLLTVGPPSPGAFVFQGTVSSLYQYYRLFPPGHWVLGNYTPGGLCVVGVAPVPVQGTIQKIGTSLF